MSRSPRGSLRPLTVALVGCVAFCLAVGPAGAQERIDSRTYLQRLDRAAALAEQGFRGPSEALMDDVRAALSLPVEISVGPRSVRVPPDPVLANLSGNLAADFHQARDRLTGLRAEAEVVLRSPPPSTAEVRAALEDAYEGIGAEPRSFLERILSAISDAVQRAITGLVQFSGFRTILEWVAVLALVAVALRVLLRGRLVPERRFRASGTNGPPSGGDWLDRSDRALSAGDVEGAVRALYRALVTTLSFRGVTPDSPSLTAGECRAAVARLRPGLAPLVARATLAYERVAYGSAPPDRTAVEALREAARAARSA